MVENFNDLYMHYGHEIVIARYTDTVNEPINVSIECQDCYEVLTSYDR